MLNGVTGHLRRRGLPAVQPNRRGCEEQVPTWLLPHQGGAESLLFTGHLLCARQWVCALITCSHLPQARASAGCPGLCTRPVLRLSWCSRKQPLRAATWAALRLITFRPRGLREESNPSEVHSGQRQSCRLPPSLPPPTSGAQRDWTSRAVGEA